MGVAIFLGQCVGLFAHTADGACFVWHAFVQHTVVKFRADPNQSDADFYVGRIVFELPDGLRRFDLDRTRCFFCHGALAAAIFDNQLGLPFPLVLLACGLAGALVGTLAGLPSLRVRGLYFVLSTLAVHYVVTYAFLEYQFKFFDVVGIPYATPRIGDFALNTPVRWYAFLLPLVILVYLGLKASLQSREGLAMRAMRDHELAATSVGVDVRILRLKAFGLSSAIASVAGALFAY